MHSVTQFLLVLAIVTFAMSLPNAHLVGATPVPSVFVDPARSTADLGSIFDVRVNVSGAVAVAGYSFDMLFNPNFLVATGWRSGGFLESSGVATMDIVGTNQSDLGHIALGDVLMGPGSARGNGTLVILSFKVIGNGNCTLHVYNTVLTDQNNELVEHTEADGSFTTPSTPEFPPLLVLVIFVAAVLLTGLAYGIKRFRSRKTAIRRTSRVEPVNRAAK